ncbi:MAG: alpha/beta hydrolase [Chthoniobacteraceae bacterium]
MTAVRIVFALLFFVVSTLVFIPAPSLFAWQLKLAATEYGHWMVLGSLAVIVAGRRRSGIDSASVVLAALAGLLFLSSAVRASMFAGTAKSRMDASFPATADSAKRPPFSLPALWFGKSPVRVEVQTLAFAEHDANPLRLDFYAPQGRAAAPCVIVLHGGGWEQGERHEFAAFNHLLAARGYAVAAIDYRLAPRWTWPAPHADTLAALRYLEVHAGELGIDPQRFVLMGRSAGGQIAESVAAPGEHPGIVGCIALYAPADMHFAHQYAKRSDILNSEKLLRQFLGGTPLDAAANYDSASGYGLANPKTPPTLLIHGAKDELVWVKQSERYAERLRSLEVRHVFLRPPWATHAFDHGLHTPGGQLTAWAVERFLVAVTQSR